jgi:glycosyltransferase involved in cell wall biosynthesis
LRFYQFLPALKQAGIDVSIAPLVHHEQLTRRLTSGEYDLGSTTRSYAARVLALVRAGPNDVLWIEKEIFPWIPSIFERLPLLLKVPYVVDYDDAIFHTYDQHPNPGVRATLGRKIATVMRHAAVVTAGNTYLADYARAAGAKRIVEIPTVVDVARYMGAAPPRSAEPFRIGWIGTPSTSRHLPDIAEPLQQLAASHTVQLVVVGAQNPMTDAVSVEVRQWREATEVQDIKSFDVGVMPLADEPFTRGKCGYKLIQYMAAGLPTVASPTGMNATIVDHGRTGFLATSPEEWLTSLDTLVGDPRLRAELGEAGRNRVIERYSLEAALPSLVAALREGAS